MEEGFRQVPQGHCPGVDSGDAKQRSDPPAEVAEVLGWVARNSAPVSALAEAATARKMLDQATGRLDGKNAAASTARRNRTILANAMDFCRSQGLIGNFAQCPMSSGAWMRASCAPSCTRSPANRRRCGEPASSVSAPTTTDTPAAANATRRSPASHPEASTWPSSGALRVACCLPVHALPAPIARIIALTAPKTLGLSGTPFHEPFHGSGAADY